MRLWHHIANWGLCWVLLSESSLEAVVKTKLLHIMVRINGQEKELGAGEQLDLVRGDELTLLYGTLQGTARGPDLINFVGFRGDGPRYRADDDLNIPIDTGGRGLKRGWSKDKQGKQYRIEAKTGATKHGEVTVSILTPELKELRFKVRNQEHSLSNGQTLSIHEDDPINVDSITTNNSTVDQQARVEFIERKTARGKRVELKIFYRNYSFASIFLDVEPIAAVRESRD